MRIVVLGALAATLVSGCASGRVERLRAEIGQIEGRVAVIEQRIDASTAPIAQSTEGVKSHVSYAPLTRWIEAFNRRSDAERTISFQQTAHTGYLRRQSHRCSFEWPSTWRRRDGQEAQFSNHNVTRGRVLVRNLTVTPQADGLLLSAPLDARFSTTVSASYRPACLNWNRFPPVGIDGVTRPEAAFRMKLGMKPEGVLGYTLDLASPSSIDLELSTDVGPFTVRMTVPVKNVAARLSSGEISLMLDNDGSVVLPDGEVIGYRVATINPQVRTVPDGIEASSDIAVEIEHGALRSALQSDSAGS